MSGPNPEKLGVLLGVARVLGLPDGASLAELQPSGLWKVPQRELLEIARLLGLSKVSRLNKQALLARIWESLERIGAIGPNGASEATPQKAQREVPSEVPSDVQRQLLRKARSVKAVRVEEGPAPEPIPAPSLPESSETPPAAAHKFEVGQAPDRDAPRSHVEAASHIPWGYGRDRVTALPVDPDRLFVHWEVTDQAIARSRGELGPGGADAWLSLRVYDVSGRLFDGTNAHSYFDNKIERGDRQWFFHVGKPTAHLIVDIGMKSHEGYFVKIARSGRVEFPRREPVPWSEPEWMTVRVSTGDIGGFSSGSGGGEIVAAGDRPSGPAGSKDGQAFGQAFEQGLGQSFGQSFGQDVIAGVRRRLWTGRMLMDGMGTGERLAWEEGGPIEPHSEVSYGWSWESDREVASWTAGPFSYPASLPALVRESYAGAARTFRSNGRTQVVWGPWQIVIRGLDAHAEQSVIARWELYRSWTTNGWRESSHPPERRAAGSSELMAGASERWGRGGSELRLGGASERFAIGASEVRLLGASERWFLGSSEWMLRGSSERLGSGGSEWRFLGSSEHLLQGASEHRYAGASEQRLGGASDQLAGQPDYTRGAAWPSSAQPSNKQD